MAYQPRSTTTPLFSPDSVPDFATTYSSFEHSQPGFRFLSNDPLAPNAPSPRPRPLHQQNQPLLHHHQEAADDAPAPPSREAIIKSRYPGSDDSDFVDLLYIVDASGKTSVTDITTPESTALAAQQHAAVASSCPPPHTNAFELPSPTPTPATTTTTTTAAEPGSETSSLSDYEDLSPDDANVNELDYYAKLMVWWPSAEADELKVERM